MTVAGGEAIGLVIYVGSETKISLNQKQARSKKGITDIEINYLVKYMFLILLILTILLLLLSGNITQKNSYLFIVRVFIILGSIIPISLKVNLEFAKLFYSYNISKDQEIAGTKVRNSSIPEELGRVEYLLTDKTGTLTKNEMYFKHLRTPWYHFDSETFHLL